MNSVSQLHEGNGSLNNNWEHFTILIRRQKALSNLTYH